MELTVEKRGEILSMFMGKLASLGVDATKLNEKYGTLIRDASFSHLSSSGMAYEGALLYTVLYKLTPYAIKINELLPENARADKQLIIKTCLLQHLSKAVRMEKNTNDWEVKNRGFVYRFKDDNVSVKGGLYSMMMCLECGIPFTLDESEVMTVNDRDATDMQARYHSSTAASVVRMANELVYVESAEK